MILAATEKTMAMDDDPKDKTFQMRYSDKWMKRVEYAAAQLSLSAAAYIRQAVVRYMNQEGVPDNPPSVDSDSRAKSKKRRGKKGGPAGDSKA